MTSLAFLAILTVAGIQADDTSSCAWGAPPEVGTTETVIREGALYVDDDGSVKLCFRREEGGRYRIEYLFSRELTEQLTPLANVAPPLTKDDECWLLRFLDTQERYSLIGKLPPIPTEMPHVRTVIFVILRMHTRVETTGSAQDLPMPTVTCRVESAQVIEVERVSQQWLYAWRNLHRLLPLIVTTSLTVPSADKRCTMSLLLEQANSDLCIMAAQEAQEYLPDAVKGLLTKGRSSSYRQREWRRKWQLVYEEFVKTFKVVLHTPLPPVPQTRLAEYVAPIKTRIEFNERIKQNRDPLLEYLCVAYPRTFGIFASRPEDSSEEYFKQWKEMADFYSNQLQGEHPNFFYTESETTPWLRGVVSECLVPPDILAKNLFFRGMTVGNIDPSCTDPPSQFQPGDIVLWNRGSEGGFPTLQVNWPEPAGTIVFRNGEVKELAPVSERTRNIKGEVSYDGVILTRGPEGRVWVDYFWPIVGMFSFGGPPSNQFYLSPDAAKRLDSLVACISSEHGPETLYMGLHNYPYRKKEDKIRPAPPMIFVSFHGISRVTGVTSGSILHEIDDVQFFNAERRTREWNEAWLAADKAVYDIIETSMKDPSEEKRAELEAIMERGSLALADMVKYQDQGDFEKIVKRVDARALAIPATQEDTRREWQEILERYSEVLSISPTTPFPRLAQSIDIEPMLAESQSRDEFMQKLAATGDPLLDMAQLHYIEERREQDRVVSTGYRTVVAAMLPVLPDEVFALARKYVVEKEEHEWEKMTSHRGKGKKAQIESALGVTLAPAGRETRVRFMVLRGFLVTSVNDVGRQKGIEPGDLVPIHVNFYDDLSWEDDVDYWDEAQVWLKPPKETP